MSQPRANHYKGANKVKDELDSCEQTCVSGCGEVSHRHSCTIRSTRCEDRLGRTAVLPRATVEPHPWCGAISAMASLLHESS